MPYVVPTVSDFKARFPEFGIVDDNLIGLVLAESIGEIGDSWLEKDRASAQIYLTAHQLAMEGEPQRSSSAAGGGAFTGPLTGQIVEMKDRDVSVRFSDNSTSDSGKVTLSEKYQSTAYGQKYWLLLKRNVPSMIAV